MTEQEWLERLREEGITGLTVVHMDPNTVKEEHTHEVHTIHVILEGELTLVDAHASHTYVPQQRVNILKGTTHVAKFGPDGCTMIVGVRDEENRKWS